MYLYRIYCRKGFMMAESSDGWTGYPDEDVEHVRRCLAAEVCYKPSATVEEINGAIVNREQRGMPTFLVIPAKGMKKDFFDVLLGHWPRVTFIFHGEELDRREVQSWAGGRIEFLEPPLAPEDEAMALRWWGDLLTLTGMDKDSIKCGRAFTV
jgi:hypothetical protein